MEIKATRKATWIMALAVLVFTQLGCSQFGMFFKPFSPKAEDLDVLPEPILGRCLGAELTNTPYAAGAGTSLDPYIICTAAQMNSIGLVSSDWSKAFLLAADIDMTPYAADGAYNMIGNVTTNFTGIFDGGAHTISHLSIYGDTAEGIGLFGYAGSGAEIKNLTLADVSIVADNIGMVKIGAVVGSIDGGMLSNVAVASGTIAHQGTLIFQLVGGIAGGVTASTLTNLRSSVTIPGANQSVHVGGVVGNLTSSTATSLFFTGSFTSGMISSVVGGLVGFVNNSTITNSGSSGPVFGASSQMVGGAFGTVTGTSNIRRVFATGNVVGYGFGTGGLIGQLTTSATYGIHDCYARGSVVGVTSTPRGGLIGKIATNTGIVVATSYATGVVETLGTMRGAFVGDDHAALTRYGVYTASFWNNQLNPTLPAIYDGTTPAGVLARNTLALQTMTTYTGAGWDPTIWNLSTDGQYPKLLWEP